MGLHLGLQDFVRRISIRDAEIFAFGEIAESPKFSGEEDSSLQTAVCLIERSELWMEED